MTALALVYLATGVLLTVIGTAAAIVSYRCSYAAGHYSAGEPRFFEVPEATASGWAMLCAAVAGITFTLAGYCLNTSMAVCA